MTTMKIIGSVIVYIFMVPFTEEREREEERHTQREREKEICKKMERKFNVHCQQQRLIPETKKNFLRQSISQLSNINKQEKMKKRNFVCVTDLIVQRRPITCVLPRLSLFYSPIINGNLINQKTLRLILFRLFFSHHLQIKSEQNRKH